MFCFYCCSQACREASTQCHVTSPTLNIDKHADLSVKNNAYPVFPPSWRNEMYQSTIHPFYRLFSPLSPKKNKKINQKGKLLVLFWKIFQRKKNDSNWLNPLFSLSIKQVTRLELDVWASWAPGHAAECISKALFDSKQSIFYSHHTTRMRI